jgi:hypothetical protein
MVNIQLTRPPREVRRRVFVLRTLDDLADLLEVRRDQLSHYAYSRGCRYREFTVRN